MKRNIKNKPVLITGGASGIGRLLALSLAELGAKVIVWDLSEAALKALEREAAEKGFFIKGAVCDVTNREQVYRMAGELQQEMGPLALLVNNAGVVSGKTLLETPDEKINLTMQVNTMAHFWTCKAFLPGMIAANSGHLVTISSAAGIIGVKGLADYSASKFAVFGLHEAIRMELKQSAPGVRTTIVCPFFTDTGMFKGVRTRFPLILPILQPEYVAKQITKAVLRGTKRLIMPRFVYSVNLLRLLPVTFMDFIAEFFGISHSMDKFVGRSSGQNHLIL
ncbi:MAG: SDR family oxidoreductase [Spirochaetaceae bacterium]|jgi:all-trans-retinol dehydrogenase (NAD+)|nr:SDR family oxidoreductase [Spirochaetaceae bacterium]